MSPEKTWWFQNKNVIDPQPPEAPMTWAIGRFLDGFLFDSGRLTNNNAGKQCDHYIQFKEGRFTQNLWGVIFPKRSISYIYLSFAIKIN